MWKAKTKNGKEVSELNTKWEDTKDNISELLLVTKNNQIINLPKNMDSYIQFKSAMAELGINKGVQIESRVIGFVIRDTKVLIRVNEKNNNINIEVI